MREMRNDRESPPEVRHWSTEWQEAGPVGTGAGAGGRLLVLTTEGGFDRAVRRAAAPGEVDVVSSAERLVAALREDATYDRILIVRDARRSSAEDIRAGAAAAEREFLLLFHVTKALLETRRDTGVRLVYAYTSEPDDTSPEHAAAGAFAKVIGQERPDLRARTVAVTAPPASSGDLQEARARRLLAELADLSTSDYVVEVRHDGDRRLVRQLYALPAPNTKLHGVWGGGAYLITGGLGGLGRIIARELARETQADLVLAGRRSVDADARQVLAELEYLGSRVEYVQADIATADGVAAVVSQAKDRFGALAGVIHSAGVLHDSFLLRTSEQDTATVLSAKIHGTALLDDATRDEPLDFFVLFSSLAGTLGNVGQAAYGFANSYLDHYASRREQLRRAARRSGRTVSIAWPLWDEGTMRDDASHDRARNRLGLHALTTREGVDAFWRAIGTDAADHVVVVKGEPRTWDALAPVPCTVAIDGRECSDELEQPETFTPLDQDAALRKRARAYLVELVSRFTKLPLAEIRTDASFGRYGIESIMTIAMVEELERDLGPLSKTLFFEYDGVDELAGHLLRAKPAELRAHFGIAGATLPAEPPPAERSVAPRPEVERPAAQRPEQTGPRVAAPVTPGRAPGKWDLLVARGHANRPSISESPAEAAEAAGPEGFDEPRGSSRDYDRDDIAVIGIAGRYPEAGDLDAFWENLRSGRDSVTEVPARRWDHAAYFDEQKSKPGRTYSRWGGFLDGVELFDPLFFGIAPAEAEFLDPQERLFLETAWHAVEDSGYPRRELAGGKVGVFVGVMFGLYQLLATDQYGGRLHGNSSYASVANRVSHFFDFHGPSMTIDTMCSSSLVAVHQACASIRNGESELAIAGGVNVISHPAKYVQLSQGAFLSTDGRCRSFGAGGDGYVPGEGVGAVLLKPLHKARADGDQIQAVIRGSAVNAGGRTSGYTVPNPDAQAELITSALADAGLGPRDISYVEAHGTGTALGDPIEITGLTKAYRRADSDADFPPGHCAVGSVKSNIGHLESAAGIAALTKVILQLRHRKLAPSLHAEPLNPLIDFTESPFAVQRELADWGLPTATDGRPLPRRAAISAFGAGGTNAHLIVEEPPAAPETRGTTGEQVFTLSARDSETLDALARTLLGYLDPVGDGTGGVNEADAAPALTAGEVRTAARGAVAAALAVDETEVDDDEHYADHGLDPYGLAAVWRELGEQLGRDLPAEVMHEHPTVNRTAAYLADDIDADSVDLDDLAGSGNAWDTGALPNGVRLADLAYTLQAGREPMAMRLAVTASDVEGLRTGLLAYLGRREGVFGVRYGSTEEYASRLSALLEHEMVGSITRRLLDEGRLDEAAELWVMGAEVDWSAWWVGRPARRISLPPRPLRRETHWITPVGLGDPLVPALDATAIHPTLAPAPSSLPADPAGPVVSEVDDGAEANPAMLQERVLAHLRSCFGTVLKIAPERFGEGVSFEEYGLDSVSITRLNGLLEETYGQLPTSLLFTYRSLGSLARYLCENHTVQPATTEVSAPKNLVPTMRPAEPVVPGDIAIIGISGRYPGAATLGEFEENLAEGRDCITEVPAERWDHRDYPHVACRWGGFIDDPLTFDPSFFGVAPNAAAYMDPQERLFVQSVWHAVEDAGYTPETLTPCSDDDRRANVAVYAGVSFNEYALYGAADFGAGKDMPIDSQLYSVANRVSYLLNLRGPSLVVDTACSSSLYAIHLACKAIREGDCEVALAGGVNLNLHPGKYVTLDMFNFLAPDGHCKSFGAGGNGYVPADGLGTVVLKPLAAAEADGDHIHGVIKGSAVNHGGRTNGYTVPNPVAQAEVVRTALTASGVDPASIGYLEAHGTGTQLGDGIEVEALSSVFDPPACGGALPIGSVKSNIGHAEAAAGISALTKVLLQLRSGRLFPSRLNSDRLNPDIDFERLGFRVASRAEPWQAPSTPDGGAQPRRAGISSFGVGGVNVHLVVEEYTGHTTPRRTSEPQWVRLSAMNSDALVRYVAEVRRSLDAPESPGLADLAFTLRTGRRELPYRVAFVAATHAELKNRMDRYLAADGGTVTAEDVFAGDIRSGLYHAAPATSGVAELARLWAGGATLDDVVEDPATRRVPMPGYPFEKETYWLYREPVRTPQGVPPAPSAEEPAASPASSVPAPGAPVDDVIAPDPVPAVAEASVADDVEVAAHDVEGVDDAEGVDESGKVGDELAELMNELVEAFPDERHPILTSLVQGQLAVTLGFTEGRLPEYDRGLFDLGMDSLSATQTHSSLERFFGRELDQQLFFNYPTVKDVAEYLLDLLDVDNYEPPVIEPAASQRASVAEPTIAEPKAEETRLVATAPVQDTAGVAVPKELATDVLDADLEAMSEQELVALLEHEIARDATMDAAEQPNPAKPADPAESAVDSLRVSGDENTVAADVGVPLDSSDMDFPELAEVDPLLSAKLSAMSERELVALLEQEIALDPDAASAEVGAADIAYGQSEAPSPRQPQVVAAPAHGEEAPAPETGGQENRQDRLEPDPMLSADIEAMSEQELVALLENEVAINTDVRNRVA